eukprot:TRINITY_DN1964_c0_g1_i1.p1 TRINITY_DN1964_c0_g1~~TRINITY_DN1964_c0_g1_i1.p1  ORF type:complete len:187 (+),score=14.42 TRINITY_DN1964_c0_g1_i1:75-635(+)
MIRRPPRSTLSSSSAASDVYKRQTQSTGSQDLPPMSAATIPAPKEPRRLRFGNKAGEPLHVDFYSQFDDAWSTLSHLGQQRHLCKRCKGDGNKRPVVKGLKTPCDKCGGTGIAQVDKRPQLKIATRPGTTQEASKTFTRSSTVGRICSDSSPPATPFTERAQVSFDCQKHYAQNKGSWMRCTRERM